MGADLCQLDQHPSQCQFTHSSLKEGVPTPRHSSDDNRPSWPTESCSTNAGHSCDVSCIDHANDFKGPQATIPRSIVFVSDQLPAKATTAETKTQDFSSLDGDECSFPTAVHSCTVKVASRLPLSAIIQQMQETEGYGVPEYIWDKNCYLDTSMSIKSKQSMASVCQGQG